jgi:Fe-S cluster assembly iron-binding protein IscA
MFTHTERRQIVMITVKDRAAEKYREVAATRPDPEKLKIRVYMSRAGWAGPRLAAALDEREFGSDIVIEDNGARVVYTKDIELYAPRKLRVDYGNSWFSKGFRVYWTKRGDADDSDYGWSRKEV